MLEDEGLRLGTMADQAFGDIAVDMRQLVRTEPGEIEAPQIDRIMLADGDRPVMLGKQAEKRAVPEERTIRLVEQADADIEAVEQLGHRRIGAVIQTHQGLLEPTAARRRVRNISGNVRRTN
jgi:hypothetical protein